MSIELPVLRLGLAGFTAQQQALIDSVARRACGPALAWSVSPPADADAWWINGARTHPVADGTWRVNPGTPTARSLHFDLREIDRPLAIARPLPAGAFAGDCSFDLKHPEEPLLVLERFTAWLRPMLAQFGLASAIADHAAALGGGTYQVLHGTTLVAVVDMRGDVGVLPTAGVGDFHDAYWRPIPGPAAGIPEHFARLSLSQLMWHFALRTQRDLLPAHYHTGLLYFRRPPRVPQRLLRDTHLLLLRELAVGCATAQDLHLRTGLPPARLQRDLAALYMVGAITSNPRRAAKGATRRLEPADSMLTSPPSIQPGEEPAVPRDATVPGHLRPH